MKKWDAYLWQTRDSDGDGCLETWCIWDTGEHDCIRLEGAPNNWPFETAPAKSTIATLTPEKIKEVGLQHALEKNLALPVPMESMDIMSYSYAARDILARIAKELSNGDSSTYT